VTDFDKRRVAKGNVQSSSFLKRSGKTSYTLRQQQIQSAGRCLRISRCEVSVRRFVIEAKWRKPCVFALDPLQGNWNPI
jgi:hypothetical protein